MFNVTIFYETKTAPPSSVAQWQHTGLKFGGSRVHIPIPTNLAGILSWLPSVIKENAELEFHYHDPYDHYSSNSLIIKIKSLKLIKNHNYTTIKIYSLLVVHPKILKLVMTKDVKHFKTSEKMLLSEHKNANMFKAKTLIEKGVPGTSTSCPDQLSRQFLTTASTCTCSSKNSSAEHIHAFLLRMSLCS